jgi:hypothetical protein
VGDAGVDEAPSDHLPGEFGDEWKCAAIRSTRGEPGSILRSPPIYNLKEGILCFWRNTFVASYCAI